MSSNSLRSTLSKNECSPERSSVPNYESDLHSTNLPDNDSTSNSNKETIKYKFGNYAGQYCGLQPLVNLSDVRLTVFLRHAYLFKDKDVLDIGCNVGHMTIAVGRSLHPKSILGIDIDKNLIARARQNLTKFQQIPENEFCRISRMKSGENVTQLETLLVKDKQSKKIHGRARERERPESNEIEFFPLSFPTCFGSFPIINRKNESPSSSPTTTSKGNGPQDLQKVLPSFTMFPTNESDSSNQVQNENTFNDAIRTFPNNVSFRTVNYAITEESQMVSDSQQYDLILCLSLTKWIHLNFGDAGLKMTFRRMFNQLRPGGKLILEAQNWASYKKRKKLTVSSQA